MTTPYSVFIEAFLNKIKSYDFFNVNEIDLENYCQRLMFNSISEVKHICTYNFDDKNDETLEFNFELGEDADDIINIVSEGMIVYWLKPYKNNDDLLHNVLNTKDYSQFSNANLISSISDVYKNEKEEFEDMKNEYSFNYGDLEELHN